MPETIEAERYRWLKPITQADLAVDTLYLWLQMHHNGVMMVSLFTLELEPDPQGNLLILYRYECGQYQMRISAASLGCAPKDTAKPGNYNRVFYANNGLYDRLYQLAQKQDLVTWLTHLGIPEASNVAATLSRPGARLGVSDPVYARNQPVTLVPLVLSDEPTEATIIPFKARG